MEPNAGLHDAFDTQEHGRMVTEMLPDWRRASAVDGVSGEWKVDTGGGILGVASIPGSGFAYPSIGRGLDAGNQNGAQYQEDDRETSFNKASETDKA